jgi:hypothetical protein
MQHGSVMRSINFITFSQNSTAILQALKNNEEDFYWETLS